jgi:protein TonB
MVNDNKYFYLSGFISLSIFLLFTSIVIYNMVAVDTINEYALEKKDYISISVKIQEIHEESAKNVPIIMNSNPVVIPTKQEDVNLDNLFSDIWTKSISKKKKEPKKNNKRRLQAIAKKVEKTKEKKIEPILKKYKNIKNKSDKKKLSKSSSAKEVNEYFAKIQAIVYKHFYPPQNSQGNTVKAVITLGALGKVLNFKILKYSSSIYLNEECDNIKQRLSSIVFPINPKNKSGNYIILLTSKE